LARRAVCMGKNYVSYDGETEGTIPLGIHRRRWKDNASIGT